MLLLSPPRCHQCFIVYKNTYGGPTLYILSSITMAAIVVNLKPFNLYDIMHNLKMSNETNKEDSRPTSIFSLFEIPVEVHLQSSGG